MYVWSFEPPTPPQIDMLKRKNDVYLFYHFSLYKKCQDIKQKLFVVAACRSINSLLLQLICYFYLA